MDRQGFFFLLMMICVASVSASLIVQARISGETKSGETVELSSVTFESAPVPHTDGKTTNKIQFRCAGGQTSGQAQRLTMRPILNDQGNPKIWYIETTAASIRGCGQ